MPDLVLPAAGAGEKEGTVINSERRIGRLKNLSRAPGEALADFWIFKLIADAWGCGEMFARWSSPNEAFEILKELSRNRPFDSSAALKATRALTLGAGSSGRHAEPEILRWCVQRKEGFSRTGRFYRPNERALFCYEDPATLPEPTDEDYPLLLLTGRGTSAQWHTNTRTAKSAVLRTLYPEHPYVEINPEDANAIRVANGERVCVLSRRGRAVVEAVLTDTIAPGQAFMPMHYEETNRLTFPSFDPYSRQPSYKASAVRIEREIEA